MTKFLVFQFVILILFLTVNLSIGQQHDVTLVHWNDVRGQLDNWMYNEDEDIPIDCDQAYIQLCFGGVSRIAKIIEERRAQAQTGGREFVTVYSGNFVGGVSGWLSMLNKGWEQYGKLLAPLDHPPPLNHTIPSNLEPDFLGLGIKEFEAGEIQTRTFVGRLKKHPIVSTAAAPCDFCENTRPLIPAHPRVAVIGFVDPTVERLGNTGKLAFNKDVVGALRAKIDQHPNVVSFIAIGSGDRRLAEKILDENPKIKIVIYSGGSKDIAEYPVKHSGRHIVKAGMFGSWIGEIKFTVNDGIIGENINFQKILVPISHPEDSEITKRIEDMREIVNDPNKNQNLARSIVDLQGSKEFCWRGGCNLGNVIADSMVHCAHTSNANINPELVAIWHSGAIFKTYVHSNRQIKTLDVHKWLPFHNKPLLVAIKGSLLWKLFEKSAPSIDGAPDWGQFLQVSNGLKVFYSEDGKVLMNVQIAKHENRIPKFVDLDLNEDYNVIIPSFIRNGKSIFDFFPVDYFGQPIELSDKYDDTCVEEFLKGRGIISNGFEERIHFGQQCSTDEKTCKKSGKAVTIILTLLIAAIIVGLLFAAYKFILPRFLNRERRQF